MINRFLFSCLISLCFLTAGCGMSYPDDEIELDGIVSDEGNDAAGEDALAVDEPAGLIYVYACGEVTDPGVYVVPEGTRVYEILELSGGITADADISRINQAESCYDGEKLYVPAVGEYAEDGGGEGDEVSDGRVDINTADSAALQQLKGIGASRAGDIISYRESNGRFEAVEDIMKVPGIKQGTFDKIKDQIKV